MPKAPAKKPAPSKLPSRAQPPRNDLSLEVNRALKREYEAWIARMQEVHDDGYEPPEMLTAADKLDLDNRRLSTERCLRLRTVIFADLVASGTNDAEIRHRLRLSDAEYTQLLTAAYDIKPESMRTRCVALLESQLHKLQQVQRGIESDRKNIGMSNSDRTSFVAVTKAINEVVASLRKLTGADAPERKEITETKTWRLVLLSPDTPDTPPELPPAPPANVIDATSAPLSLPPPVPPEEPAADEIPFPVME